MQTGSRNDGAATSALDPGAAAAISPSEDADCGPDKAAVAYRDSAGAWRKGPQRSPYTLPTNCIRSELSCRRPTPIIEGKPDSRRRTVELRPERTQRL